MKTTLDRLSTAAAPGRCTCSWAAIADAALDGLMARNPCTLVKRPAVRRREAKHLDAATVAAVLKAAEGLRYYRVLVLIAATGLRRGEALGLHWRHLNLNEGLLRVESTLGRVGNELVATEPKTERSRRTPPLSAPVVALLKAQRVAQAAERLHAGDQWTDSGLVFTTEFGGPVDPRNLFHRCRHPLRAKPTAYTTPPPAQLRRPQPAGP